MKRFLMLLAVAAVAGAMYVAAAPGSQQTTGPTAAQFNRLKKQVATLNKSLTALKKDEKQVKTAAATAAGFIASCFVKAGVAGVGQFGDTTTGYLFGTAGATGTPRTALDIDGSTAPQGFFQAVDPSCVSTGTTSSAAVHSSHLQLRAESR
jgi:outer membrane murein-binding lipoprotein Lpp